jgi:hypothetical protein
MRAAILLAPFLLISVAASAEPLMVAKGNWLATTDVYFNLVMNGEPVDIPSEHDVVNECWETDAEVTIDESMASFMGDCSVGNSLAQAHSFEMDISCNFDGSPMTGIASFVVSKGGESFAGRLLLSGDIQGAPIEADGVLLGHRTGACTAGN